MINLETKTSLTPAEIISKLKKFFGKGGWGLDLTEEATQCLTFEGGGGYITATLCLEEGKTRVNLVTQEWDSQVKEFISSLS